MAEVGRRDVVGDPLALNPASQPAVRDLATMSVSNPQQGPGAAILGQGQKLWDAFGQLGGAVEGAMKVKEDDWITEGKLQFMQGATEDQIAQQGNKFTMQGWQSLNAADKANRWFADELNGITNSSHAMDPSEYGKLVMQKRASFLETLPKDPAVRKLYVAAFDDLGPRLVSEQAQQHNAFNQAQTETGYANLISSGSYANSDLPRTNGAGGLPMSSGTVRSTVQYNSGDVDVLARTILGEAAGEGSGGMAAVAHVIMNRAIDGSFAGRSISAVAKQPWQFSAHNPKDKGGNDLVNASPDSGAYKTARKIAEDVLSGRNVDPTNGATYFAVNGLRPDWWGEQEKASGGATTIGGHSFVGKARNLGTGASQKTGVLKFDHANQTNLNPQLATSLTNTGVALGTNIKITSGQRSAEHNAAVGGAKESEHVHGNAADIDMKGMNDEQRANLVRTLKQNGVTRFGTYDNHTDMLHVDLSKNNGPQWFMHNKSNGNMDKAPAWFRAAAAEPNYGAGTVVNADLGTDPSQVPSNMGIPTGNTVSPAQTQMQDLIRGYNMLPAKKAAITANEMVTQFSMGNSQLWDSVGGTSFLRELGATPVQIRQVEAAHQAYQKEQTNKFSMEDAEWQANIPERVKKGEDIATIKQEIQERYDGKRITDETARALVAKMVVANNAEDKTFNMDAGLQRGLSNVYKAIRNDPDQFSAEWGDAQVRKLAEQYNLPKEQLQAKLAEVWAVETSERVRAENAAEAAAKTKATMDARKDKVTTAIKMGVGLDSVTGDIDGVTAKQWGVKKMRMDAADAGAAFIPKYRDEGLTQEQATRKAAAIADETVWKALLKQGGVVDAELQQDMTNSITGQIVDGKGNVDQNARDALDTYMRLKKIDPTGSYAASYLTTDNARNTMMFAEKFMAGGFDTDTSLRKAQIMMSNGLAEPADIRTTDNFRKNLFNAKRDNFTGLMGSSNWFGPSISNDDIAFAKSNEAVNNQLMGAIEARAWTYFAVEPQNDPEIILKKAAQDVMKVSSIVAGNILTPRDAGGIPLKTQMGLDGYAQDIPNAAVTEWVSDRAREEMRRLDAGDTDPTGWGKAWKDRTMSPAMYGVTQMGRNLPGGGNIVGAFRGDDLPADPPIYVSWDQYSGMMTIQLWDTGSRKNTVDEKVARTIMIPASEIGDWYKKKNTVTKSSATQDLWKGMWSKRDGGDLGRAVDGILDDIVQ